MSEPQCIATKPGGIDPEYVKRCPRRATHGEWCRQHAESLGGWRLMPPQRTMTDRPIVAPMPSPDFEEQG